MYIYIYAYEYMHTNMIYSPESSNRILLFHPPVLKLPSLPSFGPFLCSLAAAFVPWEPPFAASGLAAASPLPGAVAWDCSLG